MARLKNTGEKGTFVAPAIGENDIEINKMEMPTNKSVDTPIRLSEYKDNLVNCLRNEKIIVRHIPKQTGLVTDKKHVLYGGMAENAVRIFSVPVLNSGIYCNVLTNSEKNYLEYVMGLEPDALSIYKKVNNFWSTATEGGISTVTLHKDDTELDLSTPEGYIKYKILLAWKDKVAPSLKALRDQPKATYEFVIISDKERDTYATSKVSTKKKCYIEAGKIEDDIDIVRYVVETLDGRPVAQSTKLATLQVKLYDLIETNPLLFLSIVQDKLMSTKVLIRKALEKGIIYRRGTFYYMRDSNTPLCGPNQEPTLPIAASYLNSPEHQELKFSIEAKIK